MRVALVLFFFFYITNVLAQSSDQYLFPIQPGQTASLAGNLGELRSNHFHTGIDIRTHNQINYPVFATRDGYISRASMSAGGYGHVLYVTHSDGNTSVYAHLESFKGAVGTYVLKEQYRRKTFEIDLFFRQNQFSVKRGDTIAFSGNTGSSSGPHLHFDIRDKNNQALDPLSFAFPEVVDNSPPYTEKISLVTLDPTSRVNNKFGRTEFYVQRSGTDSFLPFPILAYGTLGLETLVKDKLAAGSPYFGGVNFIEVFANDTLIFKQSIERLDLSEGRTINTLMNFRVLRGSNHKFYKLYQDDGNTLPFYADSPGNGKLKVRDKQEVSIKIIYKDVFANTSSLSFRLKGSKPEQQLLLDNSIKTAFRVDIFHNTLVFEVNQALDTTQQLSVYTKGRQVRTPAAYGGHYSSTFLLDLSKDLPDSLVMNKVRYITHFKDKVPSGIAYTYYGKNIDLTFPIGALYDTLYFQVSNSISKDSMETVQIGDVLTPLHRFVNVSWKPEKLPVWSKALAVYRKTGNAYSYLGGNIVNERVKFSTREFGTFTLLQDTLPPSIKTMILNTSNASFRISDNLSGIDTYEATLDGKWVLMYFDAKSGTLKSERLDKKTPLRGEFVLTVTDRVGNKEVYKQKIL